MFLYKNLFFFNTFYSFNPNHAYWNQRRLFSGNLPGMFLNPSRGYGNQWLLFHQYAGWYYMLSLTNDLLQLDCDKPVPLSGSFLHYFCHKWPGKRIFKERFAPKL